MLCCGVCWRVRSCKCVLALFFYFSLFTLGANLFRVAPNFSRALFSLHSLVHSLSSRALFFLFRTYSGTGTRRGCLFGDTPIFSHARTSGSSIDCRMRQVTQLIRGTRGVGGARCLESPTSTALAEATVQNRFSIGRYIGRLSSYQLFAAVVALSMSSLHPFLPPSLPVRALFAAAVACAQPALAFDRSKEGALLVCIGCMPVLLVAQQHQSRSCVASAARGVHGRT